MIMKLARVSSKGQIVIPKNYRDFMGILEGDYIYIKDVGPGLLLLSKIGETKVDETVIPILNEAINRATKRSINISAKVPAGKNK
jgi:AbrB family looped-hinge helix DNA binding protein